MMQTMPGAAQVSQNATALTALLQYHVVNGMFQSSTFLTTPLVASTLLTATPNNPNTSGTAQTLQLTKSLVLSGFKQPSTLTQLDIPFTGGIMHILNTVLTPPAPPSITALDTGLTSLAGALVQTNMAGGVDALPAGVTIFAPSNGAFEAVGAVVQGASRELLGNVLEYHVLSSSVTNGGALFSKDLKDMAERNGGSVSLRTLQGGTVTVRSEEGKLFVNSARVTNGDIITSNGVIHVIDNVMNPLATTAKPVAAQATQSPVFAGASSQNQAPFTSGLTPTTTLVPATLDVGGGGYAALPTAALMGVAGAAAVIANL
ncbi:FAS1 domain-containing protein [Pseudomassariella vexata]|uniref:FAS1 domain-containing protein n=1 Tax=Pseudomassariella vexata TaxID=1141098 RepID=A0A1Y2D8Z7_9PEZI|nr:FAS1 domain-containing protein [Pseudomassariella vexata]ORY55654.1 FAS1 domain-containing protein [Pseudomassariella vexata]